MENRSTINYSNPLWMNKFSLHTLLLLTLGLLMNFQLKSQDFPHSPIEILKVWDYYRLLDELGDD